MKCHHPFLPQQSVDCDEIHRNVSNDIPSADWKSNALLQEISRFDMNVQTENGSIFEGQQSVAPNKYEDTFGDLQQNNAIVQGEWANAILSSEELTQVYEYGKKGLEQISKCIYDILPMDSIANCLSYLSPSNQYISQLENRTIRKGNKTWRGNNTCGHTALAMLLLSRCSRILLYPTIAQKLIDEEKTQKNQIELVEDMASDPNALSENLVQLYDVAYGSSVALQNLANDILVNVNKPLLEQEHYGSRSGFKKGWNAERILTQEKYKGKNVILSTGLTGSGHFIVLQQVYSDGITVHDPYGAKITRNCYLTQNKKARTIRSLAKNRQNNDILTRRFSKNHKRSELLQLDPKDSLPSNIGENVFFSWEECDAYKIGCVITG